jgi:hypothetical protein
MRGKVLSLYALGLAVALAATTAPSITEASHGGGAGHGGGGHSFHVGAVAIARIPTNPSSSPATHNGFAPVVHARPVFRRRRHFGGDGVGFFVPYVIEPHIITVTSGSRTAATGIVPAASQSRPVIERFPLSQQPKGSILLVRGTSVSFVVF